MNLSSKFIAILYVFLLASCEEIDQTFHLYRVQNQSSELTLRYQTVNDHTEITTTLIRGEFLNFQDYVQTGDNELLNSSELASLFLLFEITQNGQKVDFNLPEKEWIYLDGGVSSDHGRVHDYRLEIRDLD